MICTMDGCGAFAGGCTKPQCPRFTLQYSPAQVPAMGCICPPGANKECDNPLCPRKGLPSNISVTMAKATP